MKKKYLRTLCLLLTSLTASGAGAAPSSKDISATIINGPNSPVPVDVRSFSTRTPVPVSNPPIPFEFIGFPRQYCADWEGRRVVAETDERRLVEYGTRLPPVIFDSEVYWQGNVYGDLFGTEAPIAAIGHSGQVSVITECANGGQSTVTNERFFIPNLRPGTNQYEIDKDVSDFSCYLSEGVYPINIRVVALIIEFKERPITESVATDVEGKGTVCFNLDSVTPR